MRHETLRTLARYVDVTTGFVESLAQQAIEHDRHDHEDIALAEAKASLRVAQKRLGAALGQLCDYEDELQ